MGEPEIDWAAFDGQPEQTLTCRCGTTFRSHAKIIYGGPDQGIHPRRACPSCGQFRDIYRSSTDPETMTISRPEER